VAGPRVGVAIDEYVSPHTVKLLQEQGVYRDVEIDVETYGDEALEPDPELTQQPDRKVRLTKYYGLVPRHLLDAEEGVANITDELEAEIEEAVEEELETIQALLETNKHLFFKTDAYVLLPTDK
jgi:hypothetical protein